MKSLNNHSILHNRYLLYILFIIALGNLLILGYENDYYSVSVFILIGFLTSFFSKNMIVIFVMSIAFTAIIKMGLSGSKPSIEGMTTDDTDEDEKKSVKEDDVDEENNENNSKKSKSKPEKKSALSVETNDESNKEKFEQEKNVVYTSEEDKELAKTEKMILSQEKILKSMNKYKPLLDTLQGITKNMAIVKGASSAMDDDS